MEISRRKFLKMGAQALAGAALAPLMRPSLLMAQSAGAGKNVIFVNLIGGLDGLAAFPYHEGAASELMPRLRPTLNIDGSAVLPGGGQGGMPYRIGFHPAFQPLVQAAGERIKIVQGYGIPGDDSRSHDTCQILMSMGATRLSGGDMVGFLARLMDLKDWETLQYWALSYTNPPDINTKKRPPVVLSDMSTFDYPKVAWEDAADVNLAVQAARELVELQLPRNQIGERYKNTLRSMHDTIARVRRDIASQPVGRNAAGDYEPNGIGASLRDAARILRAKALLPGSGLSGKDTIILASQDGYDTHSDQAVNDPQRSLAGRLASLSNNLAVLYRDLESFGVLNDTVIVVYSEFGRTNFENGSPGSSAVGTDHGQASTTMVLGGPIRAGVVGDQPVSSELLDEGYNALVPRIDYRDIFSDVLSWLGVQPGAVFDEPGYLPRALGLIS